MSVIHLTNDELKKLQAAEPELLLLDVRTPEEYFMLGHIPGARLLPIYELPGQLSGLNPEQKTVVICEHGVRSSDASHYLVHHGFKHIYNLSAGMAEWNGPRQFASETPAQGTPQPVED
jgi:rhodanese-related sulfurtransferase